MRLEKFIKKPQKGDLVKVYLPKGYGVRYGVVKGLAYVKKYNNIGKPYKRQVVRLKQVNSRGLTIFDCDFAFMYSVVILE